MEHAESRRRLTMLSTERGYSVIERIKAEGRDEGKMEAAVRMIAAGFPSSTIADITELHAVEIEKLKDDTAYAEHSGTVPASR